MPTYNDLMDEVVVFSDVLSAASYNSPLNYVALSDVMTAQQTSSLRDAVALADVGTLYGRLLSQLSDTTSFVTGINVAYTVLLSDSAVLASEGAYSYAAIARAVDIVRLTTSMPTGLHAISAVASAMVLGDTITPTQLALMLESVEFTTAVEGALRYLMELLDSADFDDTLTGQLSMVLELTDAVALGDAVAQNSFLVSRLNDGVVLYSLLRFRGEQYQVWSMSPDTEAVWKYVNFNFNSFAKFDGRYYGANEDGLYELVGDTDAGEPIEAYVRTGLMDFGTGRLKQMSRAYLGYTASGALVLKVTTVASEGAFKGQKVEDWYELTRTQEAYREGRIPIGRGLESVYWQFEIRNKLGADFSTDNIKLFPLITARRIK